MIWFAGGLVVRVSASPSVLAAVAAVCTSLFPQFDCSANDLVSPPRDVPAAGN